MTAKGLSQAKINSANSLFLTIDTINGYIEVSNGNEYQTLVSNDQSKYTLKKHKKRGDKMRDLVKSITNNSDNYDEKYMKIKSNLDNELHLKRTI